MGKGNWVMVLLKIAAVLFERYGRDVVIWTIERLRSVWRRLFKGQRILVLGHRQSGKSSLLLLMSEGHPYSEKDGKRMPPNPTSGAVVVDAVHSWDGGKLEALKDVGGDKTFRDLWRTLLTEVKPTGVIYMLDGRITGEPLRLAVKELFDDCLLHCNEVGSWPKVVHVFLNFSDIWMSSERDFRQKSTAVMGYIEEFSQAHSQMDGLEFAVAPCHLSQDAAKWPQAEAALHKFGSALMEKKHAAAQR